MSKEPAAFILFDNMLKHSLNYTKSFAKAGVLADKESSLYKTLTLFGAEVDNLKEFPPANLNSYKVLFIGNNINLEKYKSDIEGFLESGGKIILKELTPDKFENVKSILPADIALEPVPEPVSNRNVHRTEYICPTTAYKTGYDPILAGVTNFDLYWRSISGYRTMFGNEIAPIASYIVTGSSIDALTKPAIYAKIKSGNGEIIIDQTDWELGLKKVTDNTCRIISNFLNNLNIEIRPNVSYN